MFTRRWGKLQFLLFAALVFLCVYTRIVSLVELTAENAVDGSLLATLTAGERQSCGNHGSFLIDECICNPGYGGKTCDNIVPIRNNKCRFNPEPDFCWNVPDVGRFRGASSKRHRQALTCETGFWETTSVPKRNRDQVLAFDSFLGLPLDLGFVLEIGAGPYTKTRLILETRLGHQVRHLTVVDPLVNEYLSNPRIDTSYTNTHLDVNGVRIPATLVAAGGETPSLANHYDTVILVNTLEHCLNAVEVLRNAYQSLKPGGVLIFGEGIAPENQLPLHDACHPIQLVKRFLEKYLSYYTGIPIMPPRLGTSVEGVTHDGVKHSLFAILRKV